MKIGDIGKLLGAVTGTSGNFKKPDTYIGIAKIVGSIAGGPIAGIIDNVTSSKNQVQADPVFVKEVEDGFTATAAAIKDLQGRMVKLEALK